MRKMYFSFRFPKIAFRSFVLVWIAAATIQAQTSPESSVPSQEANGPSVPASLQLPYNSTGFTCESRTSAVTPPALLPPSLQSLGENSQFHPPLQDLKPLCPEGFVPIPLSHSTQYFIKGNPLIGSYRAPGPAHALPNNFVNNNLLLSFAQVYQPSDHSAQTQIPVVSSTSPPCNGVAWYGSCFYYAAAAESLLADGGGMTIEIESPAVVSGGGGDHSIAEIAVEGASSSLDDVEMGFSLSPQQWGDNNPHLFVYHWVDAAQTCYDTCDWNQYSNTWYPGMDLSQLLGQQVYAGWVHFQGAWWAWFNDQWLGYINDSVWSDTFTQSEVIQWYGEVASSEGIPPLTQMGNGQFAENSTAATLSTLCDVNVSQWTYYYREQQLTSSITQVSYYDMINHSNFGAVRYGGPGQTAQTAPAVLVTPSPSSIASTQSLAVTAAVNGSNGDPIPTGSVTLTSGSYVSAAAPLTGGNGTIIVPSGSLPSGTDTLKVAYSGDSDYEIAAGAAEITVTTAGRSAPTLTVAPPTTSITTAQSLTLTVTVAGTPTPTGSVTLSGGGYTSAATMLSGGSARSRSRPGRWRSELIS